MSRTTIRRALVSVYDKTGLVELAQGLHAAGVDVNRKMLADIAVRDPEAFRRFAELAREAAAA